MHVYAHNVIGVVDISSKMDVVLLKNMVTSGADQTTFSQGSMRRPQLSRAHRCLWTDHSTPGTSHGEARDDRKSKQP